MKKQIAFFKPHPEMVPLLKSLDVLEFNFNLLRQSVPKDGTWHEKHRKFVPNWEYIQTRLDENFAVFARVYDDMQRWEMLKRVFTKRIIELALELEENRIQIMLFPTSVAHHPDSLSLEIACDLVNIKQIYFYLTPVSDRVIVFEQTNGLGNRRAFNIIDSEFKGNIPAHLNLNYSISRTDQWSKPNYSLARSLFEFNYYFFKWKAKDVISTILKWKHSLSFSNQNYRIRRLSWSKYLYFMFSLKNTKKFYDKILVPIQREADSMEWRRNKAPKLILFAHYQPEATTYAEGSGFNSHMDVVIKLRDLGYQESIFYREHPECWSYKSRSLPNNNGSYRSKSYYRDLLSLDCQIVSDMGEIEQENFVVVTVVGSIAVERAIRGLPTIYCGTPWWQGLPNTYSIQSIKNLGKLDFCSEDGALAEKFIHNLFARSSITNGIIGLNGESLKKAVREDAFKNEFGVLISRLREVGTPSQ